MALIDDLSLLLDQDGKELKSNAVATSATGTATQTQTVAGASRTVRGYGAPYGAGSTDRIRSGMTTDLSAGPQSVFAWVWIDSSGSGTTYGRVYQKGSGTSYHDMMCMNNAATSVDCVRRTASGGQSFGIPVTAGAWQLVGFTTTNATNGVNPAGVIGYVNGAAVTLVAPTIAETNAVAAPTAAYDIGNRDDGIRGFDGMVYQIAFFPRVLTAAEVADLYSNWAQLHGTTPSAVSSDATTSYGVVGVISQDAPTSFSVVGAVTQDTVTSYSILSGSSVSMDGSANYNVIGTTEQDAVTSYSVSGPVAQDAAASYNILSPFAVVGSGIDRGTLDDALTVVTTNGTTPLIQVKCRANAGDAGGTSNVCMGAFFRLTGANGLTPFFEIDNTNWGIFNYQKFMFSYTGLPGSWTFFNTSTAPTGKYAFNHSAAFTQDTVFVASNFPWRVGNTLPWIQSLAASGYVAEAPSSAGAGYVFGTRSATTDGATAGVGNVVPAQPLYSFKISSGAGNAPDGLAKRKMVLMAGVHAAEDVGNYILKGACAFLTSADAAAVSIRAWFDVFVYPLAAVAGRAGGAQRADFENLYKTDDANRAWDDAPVLEIVTKHKAAIQTDCGATVHVQYDCHGDYVGGTNDNWGYINAPVGNPYRDKYLAALAQHVAATINSWDIAGTSNYYFSTSKGTPYCLTPEGGMRNPANMDGKELYGEQHMRAIATLIAAGEWGVPLASVTADVVASYNVVGIVQADALGSYDLLATGSVFASAQTEYIVIGQVQSDAATGYSVLGATTLTTSDLLAINALLVAAASTNAAAVRTNLDTELALLLDLAKINGLVTGTDAVVTATSRIAGDVSQTIAEAGGTVTVSRA